MGTVNKGHRPTLKGALRFSAWGLVWAYCALIFFLSSLPDLTPPEQLPNDKVAHFLEYSGLGWLWARAVRTSRPGWPVLTVLLSALAFTSCYGVSDEWHQYYVPGRFASSSDALADTCGGVLGGWAYIWWQRSRPS